MSNIITFNDPYDHPDAYGEFQEYCITDTNTQIEIANTLPPISPVERDVFLFTQRVNEKGVYIDQPFARKALEIYEKECQRLDAEVQRLTGGKINSGSQRDALKGFLNNNGLPIPNMQAKTIERLLKNPDADLSRKEKRLLQIRAAVSKTSIAKYKAALQRVSSDSRVHESLRYYGAGKTGRWTSSGVQLHNLARPTLPKWADYDFVVELLMEDRLDLILPIYGEICEVLSSTVRSMICAAPGKKLIAGDYAAIEARVNAWLSGCRPMLKAFKQGKDLYIEMATVIFGMKYEDVSKDGFERFMGKQAILGLGYQMGAPKFKDDVFERADVVIEAELAKKTVNAYRKTYKEVPELWKALNNSAIEATRRHGKRVEANDKISFVMRGDHLHMILPNGGSLVYPYAKVKEGRYGDALHYKAVIKGQWMSDSTYGGKLCENACQRIARDLMANGMMAANDEGYEHTMSVHDEGVSEVDEDFGSIAEYSQLLCAPTPGGWGDGIPVLAECWEGLRYRK